MPSPDHQHDPERESPRPDHLAVRRNRRQRVLDWVLGFHGTPREVARGLAIGVFIAFTPPVGLQMLAALVIATAARANRAAAVAAVWITNPATAIPIYVLCYRVGVWMLPGESVIDIRARLRAVVRDEDGEWLHLAQQFRELAGLGAAVFRPMTVGGLAIGLVAGVAVYFAALAAIALGKRGVKAAEHMVRHHKE